MFWKIISDVRKLFSIYGWIDTAYTIYDGPDASQQPAGRVGNSLIQGLKPTFKSYFLTKIPSSSDRNTGWNTKRDGRGNSYFNVQVLTLSESITLYSQWE